MSYYLAQYIESIVSQLNEDKRVEIIESLTSGIRYASTESLKNALNLYDKNIKDLLDHFPLPLTWKILDKKHKEFFSISLEQLQKNLNGENEITKPFLDEFTKSICNYEKNARGEVTGRIISGRWHEIRISNTLAIKNKYKEKLEELWSETIERRYFNNTSNRNNTNIGQDFENSYNHMITEYNADSPYGIGPEKDEAYSEWFQEKGVENILNNMNNLADEIKNKLENEKKAFELLGQTKRLEKENDDAKLSHQIEIDMVKENMKKINERHEMVCAELNEKKQENQILCQKNQELVQRPPIIYSSGGGHRGHRGISYGSMISASYQNGNWSFSGGLQF